MDTKIELAHENTQHSEKLGGLKLEEEQCWENMRHEKAIKSINERFDNMKLKKDDYELVRD
jgi:hypothetical protein